MKSEKLLESTIKALQGKLTEEEDFTKRKRLTDYQKFLVLKDLYKKLLTIYANDKNFIKFVEENEHANPHEMNLNQAITYTDSEVRNPDILAVFKHFVINLSLENNEWLERPSEIAIWHSMIDEEKYNTDVYKIYSMDESNNDPLDRKCPHYKYKDVKNQKVTEQSIESDKNKILDIIDNYIQTKGESAKVQRNNTSSNKLDKPVSYKFTYYLNNATAERRETTYEDIRNDWKTATSKCESDLAAFEYFYTDILDNLEARLSPLDSFYQEYNAKTDDEKLKAFDDYFSNVDIGEGETILIKIQRSGKTIWDSEITKQDLLY